MSTPDWTFTGELVAITAREAKGKTYREAVVVRRGENWDNLCVFSINEKMLIAADPGDEVTAEGYMNGREWQGRHFAGLRASRAEVVQVKRGPEPAQEPSGAAPAPSETEENLPF